MGPREKGEGTYESPPLCADVNHAHQGQASEGTEVVERTPWGQSAPALPAANKNSVCDKQEEGQPVGQASSERSAVEANVKGVDEEIVEEGVERRGEEEDIGAGAVDGFGRISYYTCYGVVRFEWW